MTNLKALETISVERGKVAPGQVFAVRTKEEAAVLVAQGRAEETSEEVTSEAEKQDKPGEDRQTKELKAFITTKAAK